MKLCKISHNKNNKCTNVKIMYFLQTICHNSDMVRPILVILRELLNYLGDPQGVTQHQ
jgi:hypothetical protein